MLAIILCSHSEFSQGLVQAAEMICGQLEKVSFISLQEDGSLDSLMKEIRETYDDYKKLGDEVVLLVDLEHATPYNACLASLTDTDVKVISGMSLPLLLEIALSRTISEDYDSLIQKSINTAKDNIKLTIPKLLIQNAED